MKKHCESCEKELGFREKLLNVYEVQSDYFIPVIINLCKECYNLANTLAEEMEEIEKKKYEKDLLKEKIIFLKKLRQILKYKRGVK